jgi:5-methylcytosine-specific restriction endonuclease McrA
MPILPELRKFYSGPAWQATRLRILARAGNCCEQCGKPNGQKVWVYRSEACGQNWTALINVGPETVAMLRSGRLRVIRVVLAIAHLNHIAGEDRDENLGALCQWCHLNHDKLQHKETRSARKDRERPLLDLVT